MNTCLILGGLGKSKLAPCNLKQLKTMFSIAKIKRRYMNKISNICAYPKAGREEKTLTGGDA